MTHRTTRWARASKSLAASCKIGAKQTMVLIYLVTIAMVMLMETAMTTAAEPSYSNGTFKGDLHAIDCRHLKVGQYQCPPADIDAATQQPRGCGVHNLAPIECSLRPGLVCNAESANMPDKPSQVRLAVQCEPTNGYSFETALLLSIFLGMFGLDRLYLGYPAIGLLKFCTLGFFFLGQFIDILLIALQVLGPADGSNYITKAYGVRMNIIRTPGHMGLTRPVPFPSLGDSAFDLYFYPDNITFAGN